MSRRKHLVADCIFTLVILLGAFSLILLLQTQFQTQTMTPLIFVLGVFLISCRTQGYFWGIAASLISVLAVNWAFTYPYWAFDLISPECISAAVVMLIVATMTCTLTTRLKMQEKLKADAEKERMRGNLLRAVSHDLRSPLTSIYCACSTMIENYDNLPNSGAAAVIEHLFEIGIAGHELFPLLLFIGIGAMIDFQPLLCSPKLMIFGAAAQFGIFFTLCLASLFGFELKDAASIAIIGAADGPTSIFVATQLGSNYMSAIMGTGMLGIFLVTGIIIGVVALLNRFFSR